MKKFKQKSQTKISLTKVFTFQVHIHEQNLDPGSRAKIENTEYHIQYEGYSY
jgi:hypothetical protein